METILLYTLVVALFAVFVVREYYYAKERKELIEKLLAKPRKERTPPVQEETPLPEQIMTEEKADELLRKTLSENAYNQLVCSQNYGGIG